MLALDFVIPISSTSLPGGNLVDGLPPACIIESASDIETRISKLQFGPGPRSQLAIALELFDLQNRHMNTI